MAKLSFHLSTLCLEKANEKRILPYLIPRNFSLRNFRDFTPEIACLRQAISRGEGVARQNPTRILSACPEKCRRHFRDFILATFQVAQDKVIPDFSPRNFVRLQNLGYPAKQDKLSSSLSLRPLVITRGGFFYRKIRDNSSGSPP